MTLLAPASILGVFLLVDLLTRRLPNWLTLGAFAVVLANWTVGFVGWSWSAAAAGAGAMILAGFPGGDIKAVAVLSGMVGGQLGYLPALAMVATSLLLTLGAWRLGVIRVPWLVYYALAFSLVIGAQVVIRYWPT